MTLSVTDRHEEWAVRLAFQDYVQRCARTMDQIFGLAGNDEVDLRSWLYDSVHTSTDMADTIHTEPLYIVAEFLGLDQKTSDFDAKTEEYKNLASVEGWNEPLS